MIICGGCESILLILHNTCYAEIRDFARLNDFKITAPAEEMLSKAEAEEKAQTKTAIKKADVKKEENTELQDILKSSRDVLDDLKDD